MERSLTFMMEVLAYGYILCVIAMAVLERI